MESLDIMNVLGITGGATISGGLIGYAAKKMVKLVAVIVGAEFAILAFFEQLGFITVNWDKLNQATNSVFNSMLSFSLPEGVTTGDVTATGGAVGGFGIGFLAGFRKG